MFDWLWRHLDPDRPNESTVVAAIENEYDPVDERLLNLEQTTRDIAVRVRALEMQADVRDLHD